MYFETTIKRHTNPSYRVNYTLNSNVHTVVFEKNYKRYQYHFLMLSMEEYLLIASDIDAHHELSNIFNTNVFDSVNEILHEVRHDFNFMKVFCFGHETDFQPDSVVDLIRSSSLSNEEIIEYSGMVIDDNGINFLMTIRLRFNINSGKVSTDEKYHYFSCTHEHDVVEQYWYKFKQEFVNTYAAKKVDKPVNQLTFWDSSVVQMINI